MLCRSLRTRIVNGTKRSRNIVSAANRADENFRRFNHLGILTSTFAVAVSSFIFFSGNHCARSEDNIESFAHAMMSTLPADQIENDEDEVNIVS